MENMDINNNDSSPILCVKVSSGTDIILDWFAFAESCSTNDNFSQLLEGLVIASTRDIDHSRFKQVINIKSDTVLKCFMMSCRDGSSVEINPSLNVNKCAKQFGGFVHFKIVPKTTSVITQPKNAFDLLKEAQQNVARELHYPLCITTTNEPRGDYRLYNDFVDMMHSHKFGFLSSDFANDFGKALIKKTTAALYYIFPHLEKLCTRGMVYPDLFRQFLVQGTLKQNYNNPMEHKNVAPLNSTDLEQRSQKLYGILLHPTMKLTRMKHLNDAIRSIATGIDKYLAFMKANRERMNEIHNLMVPARKPSDGKSSEIRHIRGKARGDVRIVNRYQKLQDHLSLKQDYEIVSLNDFLPMDRRHRYIYLDELTLSCNIEVYGYHPGSTKPSLWFVWKCPGPDQDKTNTTIHAIEADLPMYNTRAMRRDFIDKFQLVAKLSPTILNGIYAYLSNDASVPSSTISKGTQERLHVLLDTQNHNLVFDLREQNEGRPGKYDEFWNEADKYLNELQLAAVDDRRHGTICHKSVAMSVPDFVNQIKQRMPEESCIPSTEWVYLQFMPRSRFASSAIHHTGRLKLRFMIQKRQYNTFHIDAHYAGATFLYFKHFAVKFRDHCALIFVDDKASICIGEPGVPIASVARGKKTIVQDGIPLMAADHDTNTKCKVTPSTILIADIPESVSEGSFYRGQIVSILKDTIFQPSTPMRHAAEIRKALSVSGQLGKPLVLLFSDGGPDHRVTYPSVQLSLVALFLLDNTDVLLAVRCCPTRSYVNPVERWHSVMNLALQSFALSRDTMAEGFEDKMKKLTSMKEIRAAGHKTPAFMEACLQSLRPVHQNVKELLMRLELKGTQCKVEDPATDQLITELMDALHTCDDSISTDDTTAKALQGKPRLQKFLNHCTTRRNYFFMVKKCGEVECEVCRPPRLPMDIFKRVHRFPGE